MSDAKIKQITSAITIDTTNKTSSIFKGVGASAINNNDSSMEIETLDIESNAKEEKDEEIIEGFFNDIKDGVKEIGEAVTDKVDSALGKYEWYQDFTDFVDEEVAPIASKVGDVLVKTKATVDTFVVSLGEGALKVGESLYDLQDIVRTAVLSIPTGIVDAGQAIFGNVTGEDWESVTKKMWEKTKAHVATDITTGLFDKFYEETNYGQFLKNNSYGFDITRNLGKGIGRIASIVGISIATGGVLDPYVIAAMVGFGEGAEKSWKDGASLGEGLLYASGNSLWEGLQFWLGGKIGDATIFGESGKVLTNLGSKSSTILNSTSRILLDGFDGGAEGFVQPLLASVYKDGYYDDEGNYIEFKDSDNILDKYGEIFDDYGSWKNVLTNAVIGSGASFLGQALDLDRVLNKGDIPKIDSDIPSSSVIREIDDIHGYQLNESDIAGFYKSRLDSGFFTKEQIDKMLDNINNKGFLSKETGEYISNLFEDPNYDVYVKTINDMDLDSIKEKGLYCNNYATSIGGSAPKSIDDINLDATVTRVDNVIDAINTVKNANGLSQGMNPINGTLVLKIPKDAKLEDLIYFDETEGVYLIDPKYIDSFLGVDENGVVDKVITDINTDITFNNNNQFSRYDIDALMDDAALENKNDLWDIQRVREVFYNALRDKMDVPEIDEVIDKLNVVDINEWPNFLKSRGLDDNILGFVDSDRQVYFPSNANMHAVIHELFHKFSSWRELKITTPKGKTVTASGIKEFYSDGSNSIFANEALTEYLSSKYYDQKIYDLAYGEKCPRLWERIDNALYKRYGKNDILLNSYLNNEPSLIRSYFDMYVYDGAYDELVSKMGNNILRYKTLNDLVSKFERSINPLEINKAIKSIFNNNY